MEFSFDNLLARGYHEYPPLRIDRWVDRAFQLRVRDDQQITLYFVNVLHFPPFQDAPEAWQTDAQFQVGNSTVDLKIHQTQTIEEAEAIVKQAFEKLEAQPYDSD